MSICRWCIFGCSISIIDLVLQVEGIRETNISYICSRYYRAPELIFYATEYTTTIYIWLSGGGSNTTEGGEEHVMVMVTVVRETTPKLATKRGRVSWIGDGSIAEHVGHWKDEDMAIRSLQLSI
ncbi:hypothetical protein Ddye_030876 [Dipteronia dyeriana]|uniref:Uncharacterized protein n=1 Tax=Dipteronia dyeriana TaxID=168575 RepID=A0AAD9TH81_9ROSI|nr:hypothetical protein Ddye_030876 [Dipteronia dyeriana]